MQGWKTVEWHSPAWRVCWLQERSQGDSEESQHNEHRKEAERGRQKGQAALETLFFLYGHPWHRDPGASASGTESFRRKTGDRKRRMLRTGQRVDNCQRLLQSSRGSKAGYGEKSRESGAGRNSVDAS